VGAALHEPAGPLALLVSTQKDVSVSPPLELGAVIYLGRSSEAQVLVADASVSRIHAKIVVGEPLLFVDLGSRNGSKVDGMVARPHEEVPLRVGSWIELGATRLLLHRASVLTQADGAVCARASDGPVVRDTALKQIYAMLDTVAPSDLSVLILGETGVGKEVFAAQIHARSERSGGPFLCVNCAAIPDALLEGELFGYEKGAFSGATRAKAGLFESAHGGTVLLDEIAELPISVQVKLLRVLETGEVMRLGSLRPKIVDVRFLSATNRDLRALILAQQFRADLFFRLNGVSFVIPPLRQRVADIVPLAEHFIQQCARRPFGSPRIADDARQALERYPWPGNVRELKNVIERAVVMCPTTEIRTGDLRLDQEAVPMPPPPSLPDPARGEPLPGGSATLPPFDGGARSPSTPAGRKAEVEERERRAIVDALEKTAGNQSKAAELLGMTRRTLVYRIERFGIARPRRN
jgi:transcriptional regulator with GAF, ATPase, and Fis domain